MKSSTFNPTNSKHPNNPNFQDRSLSPNFERVEVKCHSGSKGDEHPKAIKLGGRWVDVKMWRPLGRKRDFFYQKEFVDFEVLLDDGNRLILRYLEEENTWVILRS